MISVRTIRITLLIATALVALGGLIVEVLHHTSSGFESPLVCLLSLSDEQNLPTWYSSMLLFACGASLLFTAAAVRRARGPFLRRWQLLGVLFIYLSLDEAVQLHERLNGLLPLHGAFHFSWIIPVAILLVPLGVAYLGFLAHLPAPIRWRFVIAGVVYVTGALAMEVPLGIWAERHGEDNLGYVLIDWVEETLEMSGAGMFLVAIARHYIAIASPPIAKDAA
jgi:hypothetical protein